MLIGFVFCFHFGNLTKEFKWKAFKQMMMHDGLFVLFDTLVTPRHKFLKTFNQLLL